MKKYLCFILILCVISLTGCGTKEVVYDTEETVDSNTDEEGTKETSRGTSLAQALGIKEDMWTEEIGAGTNTVIISAKIELPEATGMHTQEVTEHYYTPEEQKEIAEYFLDADTIRVNKNKVISKEWLQKKIEFYDRVIEGDEQQAKEHFEEYGTELWWVANDTKVLSDEIQRLKDLMDKAPSIKDVSDTTPDYSENYYFGSKGGVEYSFSFDMEPETNTSSWVLEAVAGNDFSTKSISETTPLWHREGFGSSDDENICEMTKDAACAKAKDLCEQLGITGMEVLDVSNLELYLTPEEKNLDASGIPHEYNGYYIVLVRHINGVAADDGIDYYGGNESGNYTSYAEQAYIGEKVIIELNDKGIVAMTYQGCMTAKEVGDEVKLLSFEQIQEIFRTELNGWEESHVFKKLFLEYVRVADEEETDQYCYIPAWCMCDTTFDDVADSDIDDVRIIWINAIDGSRIDPVNAGFVCHNTPDILQGFEFNWEDE